MKNVSAKNFLIYGIDLFGVSSHLIKPGGDRRGCAQVNVRVTPLGEQEPIKMVVSCCCFWMFKSRG